MWEPRIESLSVLSLFSRWGSCDALCVYRVMCIFLPLYFYCPSVFYCTDERP